MLLNLVVYIQISLFVNYRFILCILPVYSVNVFTGFLYFLQHYSGNHSCQNYFVKTTDFFFFLQCRCAVFIYFFLFTSIVLAMCTEKGALLFSLTFC